jgi:hypothetical protein
MVRLELTSRLKTPNRVTSVKSPGHKVLDSLAEYLFWKLRYNISNLTGTYSTSTFTNCKAETWI